MKSDSFLIETNGFEKVVDEAFWMIAVRDALVEDSYLIVQLAYEFDDQDIKLGMNSYYVEVGEQSNSKYGGIGGVELIDNYVMVRLDEELSELVSFPRVRISFLEASAAQDFFHLLSKMIRLESPAVDL